MSIPSVLKVQTQSVDREGGTEVLTQSLVRGGGRSNNIIIKGGTEVLTEQVFP